MSFNHNLFVILIFIFCNNVCSYEIEFISCENDGWKCLNNTSGKLEVSFSCKGATAKNISEIVWEFKGLTNGTESVTIEDCDTTVFVGVKTFHVATIAYPSLKRFILKNVNKLVVKETTFTIPEILRGKAEIKFENIKNIECQKNFKSLENICTIFGTPIDNNLMESLYLEMINVHINKLQNRAVWFTDDKIPFKMVWDKVSIDIIDENSIHIADTKKSPKTEVTIKNCKLGNIKRKSVNIHSVDTQLTDNIINNIERSAFHIKSDSTKFSGNEFKNIDDYAFIFVNTGTSNKSLLKFESNKIYESGKLSMYFGAPDYNDPNGKVSFHGNKFDCLKSKWLHRGENDKATDYKGGEEEDIQYYKYLKKIEKNILENEDNTCQDLPCLLSISKFKELYIKNGKTTNFCK